MNLAQVLEWKYGPVANTKAVVELTFEKVREPSKEEGHKDCLVFEIGDKKSVRYISEENILDLDKKEKIVRLYQSDADKHGLEYDDIEMVITKWSHPDIKKPSASQLKKDFAEYEKHLKSIAYKEKRATEYPPIEDQLDALWKGGTDFDAMKSKIEAIKKKHPKG